jgi:hypothetical protein
MGGEENSFTSYGLIDFEIKCQNNNNDYED